jgi:anthraniloyl-CoA monooxygenase
VKITIIGGGPAGLCAARILKHLDPAHDVTLLERRRRDEAPGLGITLPAAALEVATLGDPDPSLLAELTPPWGHAQLHVNGEAFEYPFEELVGVSRAALVGYLARRCEAEGVVVRFGEVITDVARLAADCDLLVGADGVQSVVRAHDREAFGEQLTLGSNLFVWLATNAAAPQMQLGFRQTAHGMLLWAQYPYAADRSTLIVECSPAAWRGLGLAEQSDADGVIDEAGLATLGALLAGALGGARVVGTGAAWRSFRAVRTARLHHRNIALVGDAGASMYYSLGAGTMMAMQGAATLASLVCAGTPSPGAALAAYERELRPYLARVQLASETDLRAMARLDELPPVDPAAFAHSYVNRFG